MPSSTILPEVKVQLLRSLIKRKLCEIEDNGQKEEQKKKKKKCEKKLKQFYDNFGLDRI